MSIFSLLGQVLSGLLILWGLIRCYNAFFNGREQVDGLVFRLLFSLPILGIGIVMLAIFYDERTLSPFLGPLTAYLYKLRLLLTSIKMPDFPALAVAAVILLLANKIWINLRIERWTRRQGWRLLRWRKVWFWENPWGIIQSQYRSTYKLRLLTDTGEKEAYIRFSSYWGLEPGNTDFAWKGGPVKQMEHLMLKAGQFRSRMRETKDPNELLRPRW